MISPFLHRCKNSGEVTGTFPQPNRQCNNINPHGEALPTHRVTVLPVNYYSFQVQSQL